MVQDIKDFPLPAVGDDDKNRIEELVNGILTAKRDDLNADTTAEEQEIDRMVYHLYGLTYDEVKIVDPETPLKKKSMKTLKLNKNAICTKNGVLTEYHCNR